MRHLKIVYFLIGVALLAVVILNVNLDEVTARLEQVGWGFAVVLAIYLAAFVVDTFTWQMTLASVPLDATWLYRTWRVRMVGEAFNNVMPAAGLGGEPVKAVMLKKSYGIGYREATASLILARTVNLIALIVFLIIGFAIMLMTPKLPASYQTVAGIGLAGLALGTLGAFAVQRTRFASLAGTWLTRSRIGKPVESILHHVHDMDARLVAFYAGHRRKFAWAVLLAFVNWMLGALEVYYTLLLLGHPVSFAEAWMIEATAQLVRTGAFFIPAALGAQEAGLLLVCTAVTGAPAIGLAVAVVRRLREIVWIAWGVGLGSLAGLKPWSAARRKAEPPTG